MSTTTIRPRCPVCGSKLVDKAVTLRRRQGPVVFVPKPTGLLVCPVAWCPGVLPETEEVAK